MDGKVILGLRPFSIVKNEIESKYTTVDLICVKTFIGYMNKRVQRVEKKRTDRLPDTFSLVFDEWSAGSTHYLAVFASIPQENDVGFDYIC